ncbi:hypothetical protein DPX16_19530 [Anabarilius grahami]|uniref:Uncharacterized protein n=1 Tax=Anabarilius grahami TaxID=495550 RepID=A0A3N0Y7A0_ANAGA|nr:hypothetical protein DPX16_19530 [Anabarilius grahami]
MGVLSRLGLELAGADLAGCWVFPQTGYALMLIRRVQRGSALPEGCRETGNRCVVRQLAGERQSAVYLKPVCLRESFVLMQGSFDGEKLLQGVSSPKIIAEGDSTYIGRCPTHSGGHHADHGGKCTHWFMHLGCIAIGSCRSNSPANQLAQSPARLLACAVALHC